MARWIVVVEGGLGLGGEPRATFPSGWQRPRSVASRRGDYYERGSALSGGSALRGRRPSIGIFGLLYLVVGLVVAGAHGYYASLSSPKPLLSALLAVLLWPLVLLGISFHLA